MIQCVLFVVCGWSTGALQKAIAEINKHTVFDPEPNFAALYKTEKKIVLKKKVCHELTLSPLLSLYMYSTVYEGWKRHLLNVIIIIIILQIYSNDK